MADTTTDPRVLVAKAVLDQHDLEFLTDIQVAHIVTIMLAVADAVDPIRIRIARSNDWEELNQ